MKTTKISIIDDHTVVQDGLELMLMGTGDYQISGKFSDCSSFLNSLEITTPDILFLDIFLKKENGLDILPILKKDYPDIKVVIFSGETPNSIISDALNLGANGILTKDTEIEEITDCIEEVKKGEIYLANSLKLNLLALINDEKSEQNLRNKEKYNNLTVREREIFKYIVEGDSNKEIAYNLGISIHTVETHKSSIFKKMNAGNIVELIKCAINLSIIEI